MKNAYEQMLNGNWFLEYRVKERTAEPEPVDMNLMVEEVLTELLAANT